MGPDDFFAFFDFFSVTTAATFAPKDAEDAVA